MNKQTSLPGQSVVDAYALGYYAGRLKGDSEMNPYDPSDTRRRWFNFGYDKGVRDYCDLDATETTR